MLYYKKTVDLLKERGFESFVLHERSLLDHLTQTYKLMKDQSYSDQQSCVGLLHSVYGDLFGYDAQGLDYNERHMIQNIVGQVHEQHIFNYHCLMNHSLMFKPQFLNQCAVFKNSNAQVELSLEDYVFLLNVSFIDIVEQLQFFVELKAKATYSDFMVYFDRYRLLLYLLSSDNHKLWEQYSAKVYA